MTRYSSAQDSGVSISRWPVKDLVRVTRARLADPFVTGNLPAEPTGISSAASPPGAGRLPKSGSGPAGIALTVMGRWIVLDAAAAVMCTGTSIVAM